MATILERVCGEPGYSPLSTSAGKSTSGSFGIAAIVVHVLIIGGYWFSGYNLDDGKGVDHSSIYHLYLGVSIMMFVGFGYLMTFLKAYGLGAVGFTMLITCLGVEFAMLVELAMSSKFPLPIDFMAILNGNFAVAAVLISFGGLIGKVSPTQVLVLTLVELTCYAANKVYILTNYLDIADCGGTIIIHVFGAYFGLAAGAALGPAKDEALNGSSYNSDLFSLVGTVFLWVFWPSFVAGALPVESDGHVIALQNTILALLSSTVVTFGLMPLITGNRLGTVPVQNATLAGGVTIGATANIAMGPFAAMVIGTMAGALSCYGFCMPLISSAYDTCGINNLHGMPGILGGVISAILPLIVPAAADMGVSPMKQAMGLGLTLVTACISGGLTGTILKGLGSPQAAYNDETFWDCADDAPKAA